MQRFMLVARHTVQLKWLLVITCNNHQCILSETCVTDCWWICISNKMSVKMSNHGCHSTHTKTTCFVLVVQLDDHTFVRTRAAKRGTKEATDGWVKANAPPHFSHNMSEKQQGQLMFCSSSLIEKKWGIVWSLARFKNLKRKCDIVDNKITMNETCTKNKHWSAQAFWSTPFFPLLQRPDRHKLQDGNSNSKLNVFVHHNHTCCRSACFSWWIRWRSVPIETTTALLVEWILNSSWRWHSSNTAVERFWKQEPTQTKKNEEEGRIARAGGSPKRSHGHDTYLCNLVWRRRQTMKADAHLKNLPIMQVQDENAFLHEVACCHDDTTILIDLTTNGELLHQQPPFLWIFKWPC